MPRSGWGHLPRLVRHHYQAYAAVHWTMCLHARATGWLNAEFHLHWRELMLHAAVREHLLCPVYCLMPDHLHLMWVGLQLDSDQLNAVAFLRTHLAPRLAPCRLQHQHYDLVLREHERERNAFAAVCFYILANPVRAGLAKRMEDWPYSGCIVPGYPRLHPCSPDYWPTFWALHTRARSTEVLPERGLHR